MKLEEQIAKALSIYNASAKPEEFADFADQLNESFIKPVEEQGGKFQGIAYTDMPRSMGGYWIITFDTRASKVNKDFMDSIMVDDDSQPYSQWGGYYGTAWILIPYFA